MRVANHKGTLEIENHRQKTSMSTHFWKLKNKGKNPHITYKVLKFAKPFSPETNRCNLCLQEKVSIILSEKPLTNRRNEILAACRHKSKHLLANYKNR